MEQDFDFKGIGKKMPYRVPEGFFDEMEEKMVHQAVSEKPKSHPFPFRKVFASVLSAAAVIGGIAFFLSTEEPTPTPVNPANQWIVEAVQQNDLDDWEEFVYQLSDEELEEWISMDELDVFMEE